MCVSFPIEYFLCLLVFVWHSDTCAMDNMVDHARYASKHGMGYQTKANHTTLLNHSGGEYYDPSSL